METVMGSEPLGAYIRELRRRMRPKMSQRKLAELAGVSNNTVYRIEAGRQEPMTPLLAGLLTILGGRIKDVRRLLTSGASTALAAQLASEAITEQELINWANTDEKKIQLMRRIAEMSSDDPGLQAQIEGYLDGLERR